MDSLRELDSSVRADAIEGFQVSPNRGIDKIAIPTEVSMTNEHGDFIWYELMTTDADAAQAFYQGLLGWEVQDASQPEMAYRQFSKDGTMVGGILPLSEEMQQAGAASLWAGYVGVDNVDSTAAKISSSGGAVLLAPRTIEGVGRFAYVADPQGAVFYIMRGFSESASESFSAYEPREGHCAWNELATSDPEQAKKFYRDTFGWVKTDGMDLGPLGQYQLLSNGAERDFMFGGLMKKPDEVPVSLWLYYFRVPDIDAAAQYVNSNGGQVTNGPMEVPGDEYAFNGIDPQGAMFSIVGRRNAAQ